MATDIEIARAAKMKPIAEIGARLGIPDESLEPYGRFKGKIAMEWINRQQDRPDGKLILVTAINPTQAGEGKTTTSVGLTDGLNRIGKNAAVCLREPSLGPSFGMKGGAAGGGFAQVVPMEDINLRSEEHTSELQSLLRTSYDVFCLKKKIVDKDKHTDELVVGQDYTEDKHTTTI